MGSGTAMTHGDTAMKSAAPALWAGAASDPKGI